MDKIKVEGPKSILFLVGIFIISTFFYALLCSTLFFLLGIPIGVYSLPLTILCSGFTCFLSANRSKKQCAAAICYGIIIFVIAAWLSCHVYDQSWDGNCYHKAITGTLKWGWNPLQETFFNFAENYPFLAPISDTWYDAYPKATEIWAAGLYAIVNNIEVGKCFNLLSMIAAFCIACEILRQTRLYSRSQEILCALLCVANPVVFGQMIMYYVDGFLWQMFLICMAALLYLTFFEEGIYKKDCLYLVFISVCIGLNTKFSALFYFGLLCGSFFCFWTVRKIKGEGWSRGKKWIWIRFLFFAETVVFSVGIAGMTSYGINILRHKNPVYTMIGEGSTEMITVQLPVFCKDMSNISRFLTSLFSITCNDRSMDTFKWKIPFTYSASEISEAQGYDTRVAGWGILFSGIFLISVSVICYYLLWLKRKGLRGDVAALTVLLLGVWGIAICVVPGLSWARYNGALFYIPVAALLFLFASSNRKQISAPFPIFVAGVLSTTLFLNMVPSLERIKLDFDEYSVVRTQLLQFKTLTEISEEEIIVGYTGTNEGRFEGRFFTLYDMGITNFRYGEIDKENQTGTLFTYGQKLCYEDFRPRTVKDVIEVFQNTEGKLFVFAVKDEGSQALTSDFINSMRRMGLKFDLEGQYRASYGAVVSDGKVLYEKLSKEELGFQTEENNVSISLVSAGYENGNRASIKIDDKEYAINSRGINVVIYDLEKHVVVDSLCIDTYSNNKVSR